MSEPKNPPLFGIHNGYTDPAYATEITLRDLFAAAALADLGPLRRGPDANVLARDCYTLADAMLRARESERKR